MQKREWLWVDPEPSEVVSPDMRFLTNLIVSITGCRVTGVEMQDVKLRWEWLRRCFRHIIEFVLPMPFKFCFLVGHDYASSLPLLCPHPLVEQNSRCNQRVFCVIKADPVILLIPQICLVVKSNLFCRQWLFWGEIWKRKQIAGNGRSWVKFIPF